MSALEGWAKSWLVEPKYVTIFKPTVDVVKDYLCTVLLVIASVVLAISLAQSVGTGPVVCFVVRGESDNTSNSAFGPIPNGAFVTLVNYANIHQSCTDSALTVFMQYLPFILLLQAATVILVEKMLMKVPRVSGKIERFYGTIVEESLFGKDPDVAEDVCDNKANSEAIARRRRRNEVCVSLKRSSIIHTTYIFKNILEIAMILAFIPLNFIFALESEVNTRPSECSIPVGEVPILGLGDGGHLIFQCSGKRVTFFLQLLYVQLGCLALVVLCSCGSLLWCTSLRSVSQLLKKIQRANLSWDKELDFSQGKDFLFLFDLLCHTSGIESTLRVLTHADDTFRKICLPQITNDMAHVRVEEDKLRVVWDSAPLELWLKDHSHKGIQVDSYDVTIFPAETVNNSKTLLPTAKDEKTGMYTAWFFDLQGGKTEYAITIACVIGKSRMKGERIVTTLLPYGPEKPRGGVLKSTTTDMVEITWDPPKGGFTKYVLCVDPTVSTTLAPPKSSYDTIQKGILAPRFFYLDGITNGLMNSSVSLENLGTIRKDTITTRELSNLLTEHKVKGLSPGCTYGIELKTITGSRQTRQSIFECVMTEPLPVHGFTYDKVTTSSVLLQWLPPESHQRLKAFNLHVLSNDKKVTRNLAMLYQAGKSIGSFLLESLPSGTQFTVSITSVCVFEKLKTLSTEAKLLFQTLPEPPSSLLLESRSTNSITVKWDTPVVTHANHRYRLSIEAPAISYSSEYCIPGDKTTFNFSKLPEILGTGEQYTVRVEYLVTPTGSDQEVHSEPLLGAFTTKPLAPTNFKVVSETQEISWSKSPTTSVRSYKVRWKGTEEGSRAEEAIVPCGADDESTTCTFTLKNLVQNVQYKVNVYATVEDSGIPSDFKTARGKTISLLDWPSGQAESKPLHGKVILLDESEGLRRMSLFIDDSVGRLSETEGVLRIMSRQNSLLPK